MEFSAIQKRAIEIMQKYSEFNAKGGRPQWTLAEYMQALSSDVGDLGKLVMAKNGFRDIPGCDQKIAHELADCLWAICVIAECLNVNLETAFTQTMQHIEQKIAN